MIKKYLLMVLILFINTIAFSQNTPCTAVSANVNCSGTLTGVSLPAATTWTAAGSGIVNPTCPNTTGNANYWIKYTIPAGNVALQLNFQRPSSGGGRIDDIGIQVYSATACGGTFSLLHCFNDAGTNVNQEITVTAGTTYYIRVFDTDGSGGGASFNYNVCPQTVPGNSPCSAIPISSYPYSYSGSTSTSGYTNLITGSCTGNWTTSGAGNDMFFAVTVAANSYLEFQVTGTSAAQYTELSVLSAAACSGPWSCLTNGSWNGGLQTASYTLDATGNATAVNPAADSPCRIVWFENAGTYYIRIDGNSTSNGPFTINVDSYTPVTNDGDACTNPTLMTADVDYTVSSTNCTFTMGSDDPVPATLYCAGSVENTNWFSFTTDGSGNNAVVNIDGVNCTPGYAVPSGSGYAIYGASGQFGIMTGTCGGAFSSVAGVPCASLSTAGTYSASLPNAAPTTYYFVWDGNGGAECTYTISVSNILPLPVKLTSIDVFQFKSNVYVNWITETEINNDYFTIERSKDLTNFEVIGVAKGKGNSSNRNVYGISDANPLIGTSYYRLKQTDYDGNFEYFEPVAVTVKSVYDGVTVYPNPVTGNGFIAFNSIDEAEQLISIFDIAGRVVYEKQYTVKKGENKLVLETTNLTKGMYFVHLTDGAEGVNIKFIKE